MLGIVCRRFMARRCGRRALTHHPGVDLGAPSQHAVRAVHHQLRVTPARWPPPSGTAWANLLRGQFTQRCLWWIFPLEAIATGLMSTGASPIRASGARAARSKWSSSRDRPGSADRLWHCLDWPTCRAPCLRRVPDDRHPITLNEGSSDRLRLRAVPRCSRASCANGPVVGTRSRQEARARKSSSRSCGASRVVCGAAGSHRRSQVAAIRSVAGS